LGTGEQSVAEHTLRAIFIGYALSYLTPKADQGKVIRLCLFHDFGEGRTSDLNYVHQRYGRLAEAQAIHDISESVPFGKDIKAAYEEATAKETLEAKLAKDADQLEWLAVMREEEVKGNIKAKKWAESAMKRIKTPAGKKIAKLLLRIHPDHWWFDNSDRWFIDRRPEDREWRK
jgi:putative hydrolase of HD superfamily